MYRIPLYLVVKHLFYLKMQLKLPGNLLIQSISLSIEYGCTLTISNIYQHVRIRKVFSMSLDQHACRVRVGNVLLSLQLEGADFAANALPKGMFLCDFGHPVVVELVPPVFHGRFDEGEIVTGVN